MALRDDLETLLKHIKSLTAYQTTNFNLIDIYEGNLKPHLEKHIQNLFVDPKQAQEATKFIVPINVLQKIIDKLSKIYQQKVSRTVSEGRDSDSDLLVWYEENLKIDQIMNIANEMFNLTKTTLVEPYIEEGEPRLRVIPNDRFTPYTDNPFNPTKMTHLTILLFTEDLDERKRRVYQTYTDDEVLIWDDDLQVRSDLMLQLIEDNSGVNMFGKIPYVYVNASSSKLIPVQDTDVLNMTLEIPNQLTYLNYGVAYNAFPINYGIDIDDEGLVRAPSAFWSIKSDPQSEKQPVIGTVKPVIDISETLNFIQSELAFWLNTKGIRPGAIGDAGAENFVSGISKIVDEMDTFEARKKQIEYFENAESALWDLIFNHMHPRWVDLGLVETSARFTPDATVETKFIEPKPLETRGELVTNLRAEMDSGFLSKRRAIKKLNPEMTDDEIDELLREIEEESTIELPETEEQEERTQEETGQEVGETSVNDGHSHSYTIDADGNGQTGATDGHIHEIINREVQESDGHTHELGDNA